MVEGLSHSALPVPEKEVFSSDDINDYLGTLAGRAKGRPHQLSVTPEGAEMRRSEEQVKNLRTNNRKDESSLFLLLPVYASCPAS